MKQQRGNILFLILLAVVLFAALSYAVTGSQKGQTKDASSEKVKTMSAEILQKATLIENTINRMMLVNGCTIDNIDFRTSTYKTVAGATMNSAAPQVAKAGCAVFSTQGGAISAQTFSQYAQDGYVDYYTVNNPGSWSPGHFVFRWVNRLNDGTTADDIAMLSRGLRDDVCMTLANPAKPLTTVTSDSFSFGTSASNPPPGISSGLIDHPLNLYTDIFINNLSDSSWYSCLFGMILVSR